MRPASRPPLLLLTCASLMAAQLFFAPPSSAQGFRGLYTRDGIDVIAVGDNGETYRSLDGGLAWTERVIGSPAVALRDITGRDLTLLLVGDGGLIWTSTNGGGQWNSTVAPGSPNLRAVAMVSDSVWLVAGSGGAILRTTDAGASWGAVATATSSDLNALCFTDTLHGWAAGDGGTLLRTVDGGTSWQTLPLGTSNALLSVDQRGATVWVVGAEGTARQSVNGGTSFVAVNLRLEARADVSCVTMLSPDTLWLAGGGGFIRYSTDAGASWTFQQHQMHAPITRLIAHGTRLWAANASNRVVISSADRGATWRMPTGAALTRSWGGVARYSVNGQARGAGFALNPVYKRTIYCGIGSNVARSRDDGESWQVAATFPAGYSKCNAFVLSPKDSNLWLAAIAGDTVADRVYRSTNAGASWTAVLTNDFGEYGIPLEMSPDHPDTVWFGGEASITGSPTSLLYRSVDFGATWSTFGSALFRSPCDLAVVPDTTGIVIVGDGVTGSGKGKYYRSIDGGLSFALQATQGSSEVPGLATSRLRRNTVFGTTWSTGGVQRSTDLGATWPTVNGTAQAWGIDIARDDPNVVMFGQYSSPYNSLLSLDGGNTFTTIVSSPPIYLNYTFFIRDRATFLAEQAGGIWKLQTNYSYAPAVVTQALNLTSPVGGENWAAGSVHDITWTAAGVAVARIEYRRTPEDPWQRVTDVAGYSGSYAWTVPPDVTTQANIRIFDLWDNVPLDSLGSGFTILTPRFAATPDTLHLPAVQVGYQAGNPLRIDNSGNASLNVSAISVPNTSFWAGRTSLVIAAGQSDTVGVYYRPAMAGPHTTTLTLTSNAAGGPHTVVAEGFGVVSLSADPVTSVAFDLAQNRPNPWVGSTVIEYALPRSAYVVLEVFDLRGERVATVVRERQSAGRHQVRFAAGARDAAGVPAGRVSAGVYFYRLRAGRQSTTRKMLVVP